MFCLHYSIIRHAISSEIITAPSCLCPPVCVLLFVSSYLCPPICVLLFVSSYLCLPICVLLHMYLCLPICVLLHMYLCLPICVLLFVSSYLSSLLCALCNKVTAIKCSIRHMDFQCFLFRQIFMKYSEHFLLGV